MDRIIASINPSAIYFSGGWFRICEFLNTFDSPHSEISELYFSNAGLQVNRKIVLFFDFAASGLMTLRNVELDHLCGNSTC